MERTGPNGPHVELVHVKVSLHTWGRKRRPVNHRLGAVFFCSASSKFEPVFWVILKLYLLREH